MWNVWWSACKNAAGPFFAGFFEGPRPWSTEEPLRDDLVWLPPPPTSTAETRSASASSTAADASAAPGAMPQLLNLMGGLGASIRPGTGRRGAD